MNKSTRQRLQDLECPRFLTSFRPTRFLYQRNQMKRFSCCFSVSMVVLFVATMQAQASIDVSIGGTVDNDTNVPTTGGPVFVPGGQPFGGDFMIDLALPDLNPLPDVGLFIDPWFWHWYTDPNNPWEWDFGFNIDVFPLANQVVIEATLDGLGGDIGMSPIDTVFRTTLLFVPNALHGETLADVPWDGVGFQSGTFEIIDPTQGTVLTGTVDTLVPEPTTLGLLALGGLMLARRRRRAQ